MGSSCHLLQANTNDLNLKLDVSVRDVSISNSRLDQTNAYGAGGQRNYDSACNRLCNQ